MSSFHRACAALALALFSCTDRVHQGLDEREANELQSVLVDRGFDAQKRPEGGRKPSWAIEVSGDQAVNAARVLAELGLPRPKGATSIDVLGSAALVPSAAEERTRQVIGLSGDLARTLETVEGVTSARVHLVLPSPPRPGQPSGIGKAAALLKVRPGGAERVASLREELRALISGSVEGVHPDQVTLVVVEVASTVPPPPAKPSNVTRLRGLVLVLGLTVSAMGLVIVFLGLRMRQQRAMAELRRADEGGTQNQPSEVRMRSAA